MKVLGSILIILSSIMSSYFYEKSFNDNIEKIYCLIDLIKFIKSKIEYFSISIDEILSEYPNNTQLIKSIIESNKIDIKYIDNSIKKDITSFFTSLGKGYKKEQLSLCDYTLNNLTNVYEKMKIEYVKKAKVYRSLLLFGGIGLVILLI